MGSVLYGVSIFAVLYGFTNLQKTIGIVCLLAGIIISVVFVIYEKRKTNPVLNIKLFSGNKVFAMSTLAALISYAATAGIGFMLSLYMQYILGLTARHTGMILISQAIIMSFFALISGRLSEKIHPSKLATMGMIIVVIGLAGLIFINAETQI
jgi:Na+/melibiose symporter-like transporter